MSIIFPENLNEIREQIKLILSGNNLLIPYGVDPRTVNIDELKLQNLVQLFDRSRFIYYEKAQERVQRDFKETLAGLTMFAERVNRKKSSKKKVKKK